MPSKTNSRILKSIVDALEASKDSPAQEEDCLSFECHAKLFLQRFGHYRHTWNSKDQLKAKEGRCMRDGNEIINTFHYKLKILDDALNWRK